MNAGVAQLVEHYLAKVNVESSNLFARSKVLQQQKDDMTESRARYTSEEAALAVGNRFDLVLIAAQRVRELKRGHKSLLNTKAGPTVTALQEIEAGLVGRDYLKRIRK